MSVHHLSRSITTFFTKLLEDGHALTANVHRVVPMGNHENLIAWSTLASTAWRPMKSAQGTYEEYAFILRSQQFSAVLNDGGILQVSFLYRREKIAGHRLCYYPCPILFRREELEGLQIEDFLEMLGANDVLARVRTRPALRFEYDPERSSVNHPASHLHMAFPQCRIPVSAPISFGQFTGFILRNFYPEVWGSAEFVRMEPVEYFTHEIEAADKTALHISSSRPAVFRGLMNSLRRGG
jgi:hypothetical protein